MKMIQKIQGGIAVISAILVAFGCNCPANDPQSKPDPEKVTIFLKSTEIGGKKHLELSDSRGGRAIDTLTTTVDQGTIIFWKLEDSGGIKKIVAIYPDNSKPIIFLKNPSKQFLSRTFKMVVPEEAKEGKEKYVIEFILDDKNNTRVTIDPFIRIPPEP